MNCWRISRILHPGRTALAGFWVAVCSVFPSVPAAASDQRQEDQIQDFGEFDLEQLLDTVVTASRHEQDVADSPSAITVITREEIVNTHCSDLVCLLRQVPEVQVLRIKPMYTAVGARAMVDAAGDKVLVLIDGQEINDEVFGLVFWQTLPVHLADVERIEIIRGPGSALYGANAHSMVVSIFTRQEHEHLAELHLEAGEKGRTSIHARTGQCLGDLHLQLSGGIDTAGNWETPAIREREVGRLRLQMAHRSGGLELAGHAGLTSAEGAIETFLGPSSLEDSLFADALVKADKDWFHSQLSFRTFRFDVPLRPSAVHVEGVVIGHAPGKLHISSTSMDVEAQATLEPFEGNLLVVGGNYRWIKAHVDETRPSDIHQHRVGAFVHDEQILLERLILTGGVRLDYNTITPFTVSPRGACVWRLSREQRLRGSVAQAFRKPAFIHTSIHLGEVTPAAGFPEFEDFMASNIGNPDVGNEQITALEIGYHGRFFDRRLSVEADAFYNRYRNTITFHLDMVTSQFGLPDLQESTARFENTGREVDSVGGSLALTWRPSDNLRLHANYSFRHSFFVSAPAGLPAEGAGAKGDRVRSEPRHLANVIVHVLWASGLRTGLVAHFVSERKGPVSTGGAFDHRILVHEPSCWILSGFFSYRWSVGAGWTEAGLRAFNPMHTVHRDLPGMVSTSGLYLGGERLGRKILFFFRGAI